jgi:hypothetical protein
LLRDEYEAELTAFRETLRMAFQFDARRSKN